MKLLSAAPTPTTTTTTDRTKLLLLPDPAPFPLLPLLLLLLLLLLVVKILIDVLDGVLFQRVADGGGIAIGVPPRGAGVGLRVLTHVHVIRLPRVLVPVVGRRGEFPVTSRETDGGLRGGALGEKQLDGFLGVVVAATEGLADVALVLREAHRLDGFDGFLCGIAHLFPLREFQLLLTRSDQ